MQQNTISPALPWDWNQMPPPGFLVYRDLKHEHVTNFNGRNRLLSSWIINEFLNDCTKHASASALVHRQQTIYCIFAKKKKKTKQHLQT